MAASRVSPVTLRYSTTSNAGQPWGYGGSAGVQELKDKLTSLEDLLDGQGARQEALLDEIKRSIREMTKVAQKGRFGLFK